MNRSRRQVWRRIGSERRIVNESLWSWIKNAAKAYAQHLSDYAKAILKVGDVIILTSGRGKFTWKGKVSNVHNGTLIEVSGISEDDKRQFYGKKPNAIFQTGETVDIERMNDDEKYPLPYKKVTIKGYNSNRDAYTINVGYEPCNYSDEKKNDIAWKYVCNNIPDELLDKMSNDSKVMDIYKKASDEAVKYMTAYGGDYTDIKECAYDTVMKLYQKKDSMIG